MHLLSILAHNILNRDRSEPPVCVEFDGQLVSTINGKYLWKNKAYAKTAMIASLKRSMLNRWIYEKTFSYNDICKWSKQFIDEMITCDRMRFVPFQQVEKDSLNVESDCRDLRDLGYQTTL